SLARLSPRQHLAKRLPRERQPRVNRAERDRQRLTHLLARHALDLEQHEHVPLLERELAEDRFQDAQALARLRRAVNVRAQIDLRVDALFLLNLVLVVDAAPLIAGDAATDREQPRRNRTAPFESREGAMHREE